jgi:hypothetical protein
MVLLCECPHRNHASREASAPPVIRGVDHKHLAAVPVAVSFETRVIDAKNGFQVAVCGPCVDALH